MHVCLVCDILLCRVDLLPGGMSFDVSEGVGSFFLGAGFVHDGCCRV